MEITLLACGLVNSKFAMGITLGASWERRHPCLLEVRIANQARALPLLPDTKAVRARLARAPKGSGCQKNLERDVENHGFDSTTP